MKENISYLPKQGTAVTEEKTRNVLLFPTSFAQRRLWFLEQLEPGLTTYSIPLKIRLQGPLSVASLKQSLLWLSERHETLRTSFEIHEGQPVQRISPTPRVTLPVLDLSHLPAAQREIQAQQLAWQEIRQPFDLRQGPLLRTLLIRLAPHQHLLLLTLHHIITDGWSQGILTQELAAGYQAAALGQRLDLPALPIQYADYAAWQHQWAQGTRARKQLAYWKAHLTGAPTVLDLPTDHLRPAVQRHRGATLFQSLPPELLRRLRAISQQEGATLFMTLLSAFAILLARMSGQSEVLVGTALAGRTRRELEGLIGFFVNTLPLRLRLEGQWSGREVLRRVREVTLAAYEHQEVPFEQIVEAVQPERDLSRNPLVQAMFLFQKNDSPSPIHAQPLDWESVNIESGVAKFDLALAFLESDSEDAESFFTLEYDTDLFTAPSMQRLLEHYQNLLHSLAEGLERPLHHLSWIGEAERELLLHTWNASTLPSAPSASLLHLFAEQVRQHPDAIALSEHACALSYGELESRSNQLAHYLQRLGVDQETLVGICLERSLELVIGLLAVLKAGGAYMPLDPSYPSERLAYMLADSQATVVLTRQEVWAPLGLGVQQPVVCLESEAQAIAREASTPPLNRVLPEMLAYVIYTSGSTGRPKGVQVTHGNICNTIRALIDAYAIQSSSHMLQFASFSFDSCIAEIFGALVAGAQLCLIESRTAPLSGTSLLETLRTYAISHVTLPPAVLALLPFSTLPALSRLIVAGEECSAQLARTWSSHYTLLNGYGPSEIAICATVGACGPDQEKLPIGKAIANVQVYVLDNSMQLLPIGVPGELYIGGTGVSRGYLGRPDLTAERFVPDPFSGRPGARLYRTGDVVRYRDDGNLEFLGRGDRQVKLRGFRIELGEIETVLQQQPGVQEVAVILREDFPGDKYLAAYVVARSGATIETTGLRSRLQVSLPDYMLPAKILLLAALPLSPNGKIDHQALPAPDVTLLTRTTVYLAPRDHTEWQIVKIWERLLHVERIGVQDDFFEVGGNSLLAVSLQHEIEQEFAIRLPLTSLLQKATIAHIAQFIRGKNVPPFQNTLIEFYPMREHEERLPFFCVHPASGHAYVYADLARTLGPDQPFYGLQSPGLDGRSEMFTDIPTMAAHYISELRTVQAHGPYLLGGWSMGGTVAYEMAQQLCTQGETIALLAMLDATLVPSVAGGDEELFSVLSGKSLSWDEFSHLDSEKQMEYLLAYTQQIGQALPDIPLALFKRHLHIFEKNSQAVRNYLPHPYSGDITIFRCEQIQPHMPLDLDWGRFVSGKISIYEVPGDHHSLMFRPNIEGLAAQLRTCLEGVYRTHKRVKPINTRP